MQKMLGLVVVMAGGGAGGQNMAEANGRMKVVGCGGSPGSHAGVGITAMPLETFIIKATSTQQ